MKEDIELRERPCTMGVDYNEKFDRKLEMLFDKMLDIEDKLIYERIEREEKEIKKQQYEIDCHRKELEYRKDNMCERNRIERENFRKGYYS